MGQKESIVKEKKEIKGALHISISRTDYFSGDIISGQVLIDLCSQIKAKSLIVRFVGIEETAFLKEEAANESRLSFSNKKKEIKGFRKFHDLKVKAYDFTQGHPGGRNIIGQWNLPFQVVVADYLPSSFSYSQSSKHKGNLKYGLSAIIEPFDSSFEPIKVQKDITIIKPSLLAQSLPKQINHSTSPGLCFCCKLGNVNMQAQIDKQSFDQLEEIMINVFCDASKSYANVTYFNVKLQGKLLMKSDSKYYVEQTFDLCMKKCYTEKSKINEVVKFIIPQQARLGTKGQLIFYEHFIIVEPYISSILPINSNNPLQIPIYISSFQENKELDKHHPPSIKKQNSYQNQNRKQLQQAFSIESAAVDQQHIDPQHNYQNENQAQPSKSVIKNLLKGIKMSSSQKNRHQPLLEQ